MSSIPAPDDFIELSIKVRDLLKEERRKVDVGNYESHGSLAKIKSEVGRLVIVGDIHGDYESLITILSSIDLSQATLVFLGDYIDRGSQSPHVVYEVLNVKLRNPSSVILLMGNHEGPPELPVYPHDFPTYLSLLYGSSWKRVYHSIMDCFSQFYACSLLEGSIFMVHGGVPTRVVTVDSLANAYRDIELLEELLWNDPMPTRGVEVSPRGAGFLFGPDVTERFLKLLNVKVVIRSHEPCEEGYEVHHDGKLMTIFSRKGPPYFNSLAAYLDIRSPKSITNAHQLAKEYVRKF
ncbi:MAG: metallophosphoesterase family protein [Candidatus Nezhaarchaeota archaeon]|nr:metallophosphoesterase family protein [Candidatus Nezhaarchaeota archaeon]